MAEGNLELVQGAYEAFGRGDIPAVLGILSEDVHWSVPELLPHGTHVHGRDEVGGFFEKLGASWTDFGIDLDDFAASGERVFVTGKASGTHDGKETGYGFVHAWIVRDGAAVSFDEYIDPAPELYA